jgi:hypothetical protein
VTARMRIHFDRVVRYALHASGVAALAYSCKLGFDLLHLDFHVDDCFGRGEEVAVARSAALSVSIIYGVVAFIPHERPQLLAILVGIVAELLFELADYGNRVLECIFPALEGSRIRRLCRHCDCGVGSAVVVVVEAVYLDAHRRSHVSTKCSLSHLTPPLVTTLYIEPVWNV